MNNLARAAAAAAVYYDLLGRPLTALEIFKYQATGMGADLSFAKWRQSLKGIAFKADWLKEKAGFYFLSGQESLVVSYRERQKIAQRKWRRLRSVARWLALIPFLRLIAVTGSLTAYNAKVTSDFDLLLVVEARRLWLTRVLAMALLECLGYRRQGELTQDRFCLNCFLAQDNLTISPAEKTHNWHAFQEYSRLTPIWEATEGLYRQFLRQNQWLGEQLASYPWPMDNNLQRLSPNRVFKLGRKLSERVLQGRAGEWLEKKARAWQRQRIENKNQDRPEDQVLVSDYCLMLHPQ
ncbi:MAG: hypothetical protein AAB724_01935, partial [Patescibacteria group bacterium]